MQGKLDEAMASYRRALELDPSLPQASQNLAAISAEPAMARRAIDGYLRHLNAHPGDAEAHNNLGKAYRELSMHREALASFREAVRLDPARAEAHYSLGLELLLMGEYRGGWREYESRWQVTAGHAPKRHVERPEWDGSRAPGRTLLLYAEQGMGDTMQFVRFARLAAERCARVVLECPRALAGLLRAVEGLSEVVAQGDALPPFDLQLPLVSLPRVLGIDDPASVPGKPYLHPDEEKKRHMRALLQPGARLHVGLAWAGRPDLWDDRKRTIGFAALAPLAAIDGVAFYGLQKGDAPSQLANPPDAMQFKDCRASLRDFSDTAALAANMDLVISVCTSVAHLAGGMGLPTWVLLAKPADWRWLLNREDSPWYPSARLFRQASSGDWAGVVERVAQALRATSRPLR